MLKVFTEFNATTPDGLCWILKYEAVDLKNRIDDLRLSAGDKNYGDSALELRITVTVH